MSFHAVAYDGPLGTWRHAEWHPDAHDALAPFVDRVWYFDGALSQAVERVFPSGRLELIVQLDTPHRPLGGDARYPPLAFAGLATTAFAIEAPANRCRVLGLRLHPAGAVAVAGRPLADVVDATVDLHELVGPSVAALGERCATARDGRACIAAMLAWTYERLERDVRVEPWIAWSVARIEEADGALSVSALRERTAIGAARFASEFRNRIGVTPKRFARIVRFRRALALAHAGNVPFARIAADAGFADQAHLTAEFRAHAGMTPTGYRDALRYPDATNVAEALG